MNHNDSNIAYLSDACFLACSRQCLLRAVFPSCKPSPSCDQSILMLAHPGAISVLSYSCSYWHFAFCFSELLLSQPHPFWFWKHYRRSFEGCLTRYPLRRQSQRSCLPCILGWDGAGRGECCKPGAVFSTASKLQMWYKPDPVHCCIWFCSKQ